MKGPLLQMVQPILQIIAGSKAETSHLQSLKFFFFIWSAPRLGAGHPHERVPHEAMLNEISSHI